MGQLVFGAAFFLSLVIVIRGLIVFLQQVGELRTRELRVEYELEARRSEIPAKRKRVETRRSTLPPLKRDFQKLRDYYNEVKLIEVAAEKAALEREQEQEAAAQKEIQMHREEDKDQPRREREIQVQQQRRADREGRY